MIFRLFSTKEQFCGLFILHVRNEEKFIKLLDLFAPQKEDKGTTERKSLNQEVLLAGYWKKIERCKKVCFLSKDYKKGEKINKGCFDSSCAGGWKAEYLNKKQIYTIPLTS